MDIYSNIKYLGSAEFCVLPTVNAKNLATQEWVHSEIEAITGTNLQSYVTCTFLTESLAAYETAAVAQGKYALKSDIPVVSSFITKDVADLTNYETASVAQGKYALKSQIPEVSSFITKEVSDLTNYYTKTAADQKYATKSDISSVYKFIGSVDNFADLPSSSDVVAGSVYNVVNACTTAGVDAGDNVAWTGSSWDVLAGTVDLSAYVTSAELEAFDYATESFVNDVSGACSATALQAAKDYADACVVALNMSQYATKTYVADEIKAAEVPGIINLKNDAVIAKNTVKEFDLSTELANYNKIPLIQVFDKDGNAIVIDVKFASKKITIKPAVEIAANALTVVVFAY